MKFRSVQTTRTWEIGPAALQWPVLQDPNKFRTSEPAAGVGHSAALSFGLRALGPPSGFGFRISVFLPLLLCWATVFPPAQSLAQPAPAATPLGAYAQALCGPASVAADGLGNTYVTDPASGQVVVFDAFGRPAAVRSGFSRPLAIAVDALGRIHLSEEKKGCVSVFDSQWNLVNKLGRGDGEFLLPSHIAIDLASGTAYVCDSAANLVKVFPTGQPPWAFGAYGAGPGQFDFPAGVYVGSGKAFVVDQNNDRVQVFNLQGGYQGSFAAGTSGGSMGHSGRAQGITGDATGRLYVADAFQGLVRVFDGQGNFLSTIANYGAGPGQLRSPVSLAVDPFGRLLVASVNNSRIELIGLDSYLQLTASPASQVVAAGTNASFAVAITGPGPFIYQWRKGTNTLTDRSNVTGANAPALTLSALAPDDSGIYSVVVNGPSGTFTSPGAALTVLTPPVIVSQPTNQTVLAGAAASFSVTATGDALAFLWQFNGADIPAATASVFSLPSAQPADAGRYTVTARNLVGSASSSPATLTVLTPPNPPQIDSAALLPDGTIHLFLRCDASFNYAIEVSDDFRAWASLTNVFSENGAVEFVDADAANHPRRFYRLRWMP